VPVFESQKREMKETKPTWNSPSTSCTVKEKGRNKKSLQLLSTLKRGSTYRRHRLSLFRSIKNIQNGKDKNTFVIPVLFKKKGSLVGKRGGVWG